MMVRHKLVIVYVMLDTLENPAHVLNVQLVITNRILALLRPLVYHALIVQQEHISQKRHHPHACHVH
jgi:hypothetical protein